MFFDGKVYTPPSITSHLNIENFVRVFAFFDMVLCETKPWLRRGAIYH